MRLRVLVHAVDRTGPPMLALALLRWMRAVAPEVEVDVVAFRGGAMAQDFEAVGPFVTLMRTNEHWDHAAPDPTRFSELVSLTAGLGEVDVVLVVSVAGGQCLPLLSSSAPVVTWVVEAGEDLHWLDPPVDVAGRTDLWLVGSECSRVELSARVPETSGARLAREFIDVPTVEPEDVDSRRTELLGGRRVAFVGAGIGTYRKAPDLFVELALAVERRRPGLATFTWIGGESDELAGPVRELSVRLGLDEVVRWVDAVANLDVWLAAADALVHPARLDSFPLVCLHAAAVGTPVLAFAGVGGVEEMFAEEFLGVGYPDVEGLAKLLLGCVQDGSLPAAGERQRERVLDMYIAEKAAPTVLATLMHGATPGAQANGVPG